MATPGAARFEVREVMRPQPFGRISVGMGVDGDGMELGLGVLQKDMKLQHGGITLSII